MLKNHTENTILNRKLHYSSEESEEKKVALQRK